MRAIASVHGFWLWVGAAALLGAGTPMVYPTRYAVGALLAGSLADRFGVSWAIGVAALLTVASGLVVLWRMPETLRHASSIFSLHPIRDPE